MGTSHLIITENPLDRDPLNGALYLLRQRGRPPPPQLHRREIPVPYRPATALILQQRSAQPVGCGNGILHG
jgi:hypothetical protein